MPSAADRLFEYELTSDEFARIAELLYAQSRIVLRPGKEGLVRSRLVRHLRRLRLCSYTEYLDHVARDTTGRELSELIDALTTNKTSFYREGAHFEFFQHGVLPALLEGSGPIRIWSAGCSSGEEPYTIGMILHESAPDIGSRDVRILATDICARVLAHARDAEYPAAAVREIPWQPAARYFVPAGRGSAPTVRVRDDVRRLVRFARLNLMSAWPMRQPFHAIFCRNVMIYFDRSTQRQLVNRFWEALAPGGYLFVGHSESLSSSSHRFRYVQPAVYVK
jgi:chemotaxis protein methyltransferase CheR